MEAYLGSLAALCQLDASDPEEKLYVHTMPGGTVQAAQAMA